MYLQLYWAIKIDREKKLEAGRSLLSLTQKKEAPQLCSYDHRNQTAVPILPSLCN